jgi:hypothetical protein
MCRCGCIAGVDVHIKILSEVHAGVCGGQIGARALAATVLWQGFYWPAMINSAAKLVSACVACQKFSHKTMAPAQPVQLIAPSWPLQRWGIDIVGKLTPTQGNYTFTVVALIHLVSLSMGLHLC